MKYQNADASMTSGWGGSTDDLHELPGGIEESVGGGDRDPPGPKDGVVGTWDAVPPGTASSPPLTRSQPRLPTITFEKPTTNNIPAIPSFGLGGQYLHHQRLF
jgi:hypothetical protein